MKNLLRYLVLGAIALGLSGAAYAVPTLRITDGNTIIDIADGSVVPGAVDAAGGTGQVAWLGAIGNWTFNIHAGTTYPIIGTLANPQMDLTFNATSNGSGGTLSVYFSADGFGPTQGSAFAAIGGTAAGGGTVDYNTYGGTNNTLFSTSNLLTDQGPFGAGAFSGSTGGGLVNNNGPYSLTQLITITHSAGGITTGNAFLHVPDSGSTLLLLGAGLTALGLVSRKRKVVS
jgi:hypothetical protein